MTILTAINGLKSLSFAFGALSFIWKHHAFRWNRIAEKYAAPLSSSPIAERKLQSVFLTGGGIAFASYKSTVTVGVTELGLTLRLLPPWSVFHPTLHIPFDDILVKPTSWYLNSSSYKLSLVRVRDIDIITDGALIDWINDHTPSGLKTSWNIASEAGSGNYCSA